MFKEFLKNPFQVKYIPVLISLAIGVAFTAINHEPKSAIIMAIFAALNVAAAGQPIHPMWKAMYIGTGAVFLSIAIYMVFVGAFAAAGVAGAIAALPLSILFTRKVS
jgi:hypothetical protein